MRWVLPYIDEPAAFWQRVLSVTDAEPVTVYFPMPDSPIGTGRPPQPARFLDGLFAVEGIETSVLLNPVVHDGPAERAFERLEPGLRRLVDEREIAEAVVASVGLARIIHGAFPRLRLSASTLLDISSPAQTVYLGDVFDSLTPSGRIVRDRVALQSLKSAFPGRIRLMVNEGCLPGCVLRAQHFFEMNAGVPMPESLCAALLEREPWLALTGAWVLPQHLDLFDGLYDELKLDGRVTLRDPERYLCVLRAYSTRSPLPLGAIGGGPATAIRGMPPVTREFYAHTLTCAKTCATCQVCRVYFDGGPDAEGLAPDPPTPPAPLCDPGNLP